MQTIKNNDVHMAYAVLFGISAGTTAMCVQDFVEGATTGGWLAYHVISTALLGSFFAWGYWRHRARLKALITSNPLPDHSGVEAANPAG